MTIDKYTFQILSNVGSKMKLELIFTQTPCFRKRLYFSVSSSCFIFSCMKCPCRGLNEKWSRGPTCLNSWSPAGGALWRCPLTIGSRALGRSASLQAGFGVLEPHPACRLSFASQVWAQCDQPASCSCHCASPTWSRVFSIEKDAIPLQLWV